MSNLTTRKIVLGLLITLVLAFGMQSVADAVQKPRLSQQSDTDIARFRAVNATLVLALVSPSMS